MLGLYCIVGYIILYKYEPKEIHISSILFDYTKSTFTLINFLSSFVTLHYIAEIYHAISVTPNKRENVVNDLQRRIKWAIVRLRLLSMPYHARQFQDQTMTVLTWDCAAGMYQET